MLFRTNTIKFKLLFSFFVFLMITIGIIFLSLWFQSKEESNQDILNTLYQINLDNETVIHLERDFLKDEVINPKFYDTEQSKLLDQRKRKLLAINKQLNYLKTLPNIKSINLINPIETLIDNFKKYNKNYQELIFFIKRRGFKDFGLEGTMREHIHDLENLIEQYQFDLGKLLMIRRHEKDYILRKEEKYIDKIKDAIDIFQKEIEVKVQDLEDRKRLVKTLNDYRENFIQITIVERKIGLTNDDGLRANLNVLSNDIAKNIKGINEKIKENIVELKEQRRFIFISVMIFAVLLIIFLSFFITRILTTPIRKLSQSIDSVIKSNFAEDVEVAKIGSKDEIGHLSRDFSLMLTKVRASIRLIREKSAKVERKQKLLMDSVRYAQKIQNALLPDELALKEFFEEFFIIYRPMHVVSGDFYWVAEQRDKIFIAMVDCTGHGVPGAFMSMIGNTILNKIVKEKAINEPDFILEILDMEVRTLLNQEKTGNDDGMDLALCSIEKSKNNEPVKIHFSGAKSSIFYSSKGDIHKVKGTSRAIGGSVKPRYNRSFEIHEIEIERGEMLYLSTDGFFDQPNQKRKKYGKKRFVNLLKESYQIDVNEQRERLIKSLDEHSFKEQVQQRDDITVLGIRL